MARFNEQIEPIYALLRETEDVNLSHDLLEPEPAEIPALKQRSVSDKPHGNTPLIPLSQHHVSPQELHPGAVSPTTHGSSPLLCNSNNGLSDIGLTSKLFVLQWNSILLKHSNIFHV